MANHKIKKSIVKLQGLRKPIIDNLLQILISVCHKYQSRTKFHAAMKSFTIRTLIIREQTITPKINLKILFFLSESVGAENPTYVSSSLYACSASCSDRFSEWMEANFFCPNLTHLTISLSISGTMTLDSPSAPEIRIDFILVSFIISYFCEI